MRILVLQLKRIGDLVLTFPALAALRRARPDAEITLVTLGAAGGLAVLAPGGVRHLNYRRGRPNLGLWAKLAAGGFDLCLDFTGNDRSALMVRLSRARERAAYRKVADKRPRRARLYTALCGASVRELHTLDYHAALLAEAGVEAGAGAGAGEGSAIAIPAAAAARAAALCPAGRFAVVHPGTAREEKYWLPERWAAVISALGIPVVLTGAADPFERSHLEAIKAAAGAGAEIVDLAGRLSLVETAAVLARCEVALGVDTAAMHLAACLAKPQVVLFGPTNPYHWRPRHGRAAICLAGEAAPLVEFAPKHRAAPMAELELGAVLAGIERVGAGS